MDGTGNTLRAESEAQPQLRGKMVDEHRKRRKPKSSKLLDHLLKSM